MTAKRQTEQGATQAETTGEVLCSDSQQYASQDVRGSLKKQLTSASGQKALTERISRITLNQT
jgi:hypothetical protein